MNSSKIQVTLGTRHRKQMRLAIRTPITFHFIYVHFHFFFFFLDVCNIIWFLSCSVSTQHQGKDDYLLLLRRVHMNMGQLDSKTTRTVYKGEEMHHLWRQIAPSRSDRRWNIYKNIIFHCWSKLSMYWYTSVSWQYFICIS
jgi:hypothetical protein